MTHLVSRSPCIDRRQLLQRDVFSAQREVAPICWLLPKLETYLHRSNATARTRSRDGRCTEPVDSAYRDQDPYPGNFEPVPASLRPVPDPVGESVPLFMLWFEQIHPLIQQLELNQIL
ncbi:hypothetical protein SUGI_1463370 [Cryptomeria japonica]|uniref:Uncharacterized protein n=1 Tax=Cryptomeria japonica TaxID=3369 RepID=A0AAD3NTK9_CRYJA|nr:hypothetical protein SUGI_1463370 [Cryptomeria japonica]